MLTALTNTFGVDARCFVCDPSNEGGLRQAFYLDRGGARVVAEFTPTRDHSGAPNYAHGGASMAVLDDAMAWAVIALRERFGLTRRAEFEFHAPVRVGARHEVSAWIASGEGRRVSVRAELRDASGALCIGARAEYAAMTAAETEAATGVRLPAGEAKPATPAD